MPAPGNEEWRPVTGLPAYEVSTFGRVRRAEAALVLRSRLDRRGKPTVALRVGDKHRHFRVNKLVFLAFVGRLPERFQIDHVDGNCLDCRPENLRLADCYRSAKKDTRWCGKRFGGWTVIRRAGTDDHGGAMWLCRCDCGTKKRVRIGNLTSGLSRTCGCRTIPKQRVRVHSGSRSG